MFSPPNLLKFSRDKIKDLFVKIVSAFHALGLSFNEMEEELIKKKKSCEEEELEMLENDSI